LGSVHFLPPSAHPLPAQIEQVYQNASRVIFEVRLDQEKNLDLGWLPGTSTLNDILDEEILLEAKEAVEDLGLNFEEYKKLRPWALTFDLAPHLLAHFGATADLGIEKYFFERARADLKVIDRLEDIDYVPRRLKASPIDVQIGFLRQFLTMRDLGSSRYNAMVDAWLQGNVSFLAEHFEEEFLPFPELAHLLLLQRNRNWLPSIRNFRRSQEPTLVIVGILHLLGEGNLLQLLEARGASFEQL
jgi:uncharacterized protein YbaP (TraB family)